MVFLGVILVGISLFLTIYGVSKRITSDINLLRLIDILEFSYLTLYTGKSYEINFGSIKSFSIGNDTIKLENVCLKVEEPNIIEDFMTYYLVPHLNDYLILYNLDVAFEKTKLIKTAKMTYLTSKTYKSLGYSKKGLLTLLSLKKLKDLSYLLSGSNLKKNALIYLGLKTAEIGYNVYSKLSFKCIVIGNEFKIGEFYDYNIVLSSQGNSGNKINFSVNIEDKKLKVLLTLKEFFE